MKKSRLDTLLVERGLFPTRTKAQAAILAGKVSVPKHPNPKAGLALPQDAVITIATDACPYVSRGGLKLAAAIDGFKIDPAGRVAIDIGSSTGGFTDCLLQRGATKVYAVDVGTKQLDIKLRNDPRVKVMENTHAKDLTPRYFDPLPDLAVMDVSFISVEKILPYIIPCLKPGFDFIVLIKPQFELEPRKVPKGIVRDPAFRDEAVAKVRQAASALSLHELGLMESPIHGAKGNVEFLLHLKDHPQRSSSLEESKSRKTPSLKIER